MNNDFVKTALIALFLGGCVNVDNPLNNDEDGDGVSAFEGDCDDSLDSLGNKSEDGDCDGVLTVDDCDDEDSTSTIKSEDVDCDGVLTVDDCDDEDSTSTIKSEDVDCDGIDNATDLDADGDGQCDVDTIATTGDISNDSDCDGVLTVDDCDDDDVTSTIIAEDSDCDGLVDGCFLTNCDMSIDMGNGIGADFVLIDELNDPLERYTLEKSFYIMTTEVTQGMFVEVMGYDPNANGTNYPVYSVNWHMAAHFSNTLSIDQGEQECYSCSGSGTSVTCSETMNPYECSGYSLPTEHEWELAARSGTTSEFWTGEGIDLGGDYSSDVCNTGVTILDGVSNPLLSDYAWYCGNNSPNGVKEVGTKLSNGFGLYDMHGNVWEWVSDGFGCSYPNNGTWCSNSSRRMGRGASWNNNPNELKSSSRVDLSPEDYSLTFGFRLRKLVENP